MPNSNIRTIKLGTPREIKINNCPNLQTLTVENVLKLEDLQIVGNGGNFLPIKETCKILGERRLFDQYPILADRIKQYPLLQDYFSSKSWNYVENVERNRFDLPFHILATDSIELDMYLVDVPQGTGYGLIGKQWIFAINPQWYDKNQIRVHFNERQAGYVYKSDVWVRFVIPSEANYVKLFESDGTFVADIQTDGPRYDTTGTNGPVWLFGEYQSNRTAPVGTRFHSLKVRNATGELIHHLVPFEKDGAACLYDWVADTFIYPNGSSGFIYRKG